MPRATYGPKTMARVKRLLEALLKFANYELDNDAYIDLKFSWQDEGTHRPRLLVKTNLRALEELTRRDEYNNLISKPKVRESLHLMENYLGILEDHRVQKRGSEVWHFTLKLWSKKTTTNLRQFKLEWEQRKKDKRENKKVKKREVLEKPSETIYRSSNRSWGESPDISFFLGRTQELRKLKQWVVTDRCRLVSILGMGGIGKTYLSKKLAQEIQEDFEYVVWRSLLNAPSVEKILVDFIKLISGQQDADIHSTLDYQIPKFLDYLRKKRCLLILDNVESIFKGREVAGQYRKGFEGYGDLFKSLGETSHKSCLLLNSREKPNEIARMEGKTKPTRTYNLGGLSYIDGQCLFNDIGSFSGSDNEWKSLVDFYNGNPFILILTARHIEEVFFGNISKFLKTSNQVFENMNDLLNEHFERLSEAEKEILYWFAINREPVSMSDLKEDILSPRLRRDLPSTLQSLRKKLLLERKSDEEKFMIQPVLIEYLTERIIQRVCDETQSGEHTFIDNYALFKAQSNEYIRDSQKNLILQPIQEILLNSLKGKANFEVCFQEILARLQDDSPDQVGYAPGNIINLLGQFSTSLMGYNFSCLTILQAYLQGINLHKVNFSHSLFHNCVFTQTFGSIFSIALSPDREFLATGDSNGEIRLWNIGDGKQLLTLKGHSDWIWSVAFSPDGQVLASGSEDKTIKIWDVQTGQCLRTLEGSIDWVWSVAFSPDGQILASGSDDKTVKLWNVQTGECFNTLLGHINRVRTVAFSPDGQTLASGSDDKTVKLWNVQTGECFNTLLGHSSTVWSVQFDMYKQILVSGSEDQTTKIWDFRTGQCLNTLEGYTNKVRSIAFSSDGQTVASSSEDKMVRLWNINSYECIHVLRGFDSMPWSVAFNPNGQILASGSDDQMVRLWDVQTGQCLTTLQGHTDWVWSVAFSPNGQILASGSDDQMVRLWDVQTGQCLTTLQGHTGWLRSVAFSPNGQILASGSQDKTVKLWNVNTGKELNTLIGHADWLWSVAFNPNGQILASGSQDKTVKLWNVNTGEELNTLIGHKSRVRSVAFSPDGRTLASGSDDQTVKIWDFTNARCLHTFRGHTDWIRSVDFSPDGQTVASGGEDETIKIWDVKSSTCLKTLRPLRPYEGTHIRGVKNLTRAQISTLKSLGAIET